VIRPHELGAADRPAPENSRLLKASDFTGHRPGVGLGQCGQFADGVFAVPDVGSR
jgi:hypothetical protein